MKKLFPGLKNQNLNQVAKVGCLGLVLMSASCFFGDRFLPFSQVTLYPLSSVIPDLENNRFDRALDKIDHLSKNERIPVREIQYTQGLVLMLKVRLSKEGKEDDISRKVFLQGWDEILRSAEAGYVPAMELKGYELRYGDVDIPKNRRAYRKIDADEQRINWHVTMSKYSKAWKEAIGGDFSLFPIAPTH